MRAYDISNNEHGYRDITATPMPRPPHNNDPLPAEKLFPITGQGVENVRRTHVPRVEDRPLLKHEVQHVLKYAIFPLLFNDLGFLGLEKPDIRIRASWMPKVEEIPADDEDMPAVTEGRVQILPFVLVFAWICRMVGASTTAHRRYKNAFQGQRIRFVFDADNNDVQMYMTDELREALEDGYRAWFRGR